MKVFAILTSTYYSITKNLKNILFSGWTRKKIITTIIIVGGLGLLLSRGDEPVVPAQSQLPMVTVGTAASLRGDTSIETYGTVAAKTQANLVAEAGGRVVSVPATLGQVISRGAVVAQLENAAEAAALTQAQGAYDAALAGAAQGDSGVRNAEIAYTTAEESLSTAVRNSYTTLNSTLLSTVDTFFANPTSQIPGLRVSGNASFLNAERVAFQTSLPQLQQSLGTLSAATNDQVSVEARAIAARMIVVVDSLQDTVTKNGSDVLLGAPLSSYTSDLVAARAALVAVVAGLENAERSTQSAAEGLAQAKLGGSSAEASVANAQIKIALGSLQAAQANYAKTVIRTPITGTVNSLSVRAGDFVAPNSSVATIANDDGVEITTFVGERDINRFAVGNEVFISDTIPGLVTNVSSAIDASTGKIEIRISAENESLKPGDTVRITSSSTAGTTDDAAILLPLAAVKFEGDSSYVLVVKNDVLERLTVTVGDVVGDSITVTEGLTSTTEIVLDARGKAAGTKVVVKQK